MSITHRISAFHDLGQFFNFVTKKDKTTQESSDKFKNLQSDFEAVLHWAEIKNPWFTPDNLHYCLSQWGALLTIENLNNWQENLHSPTTPKTIGIIMAGNIPLVGLHDLLAVLIAGHHAMVKTSSKDDALMGFVLNFLKNHSEDLDQAISKVERIQQQDAVIATGSDNTARYFEFYFKDIPHIIRKNRTSVAVLNGEETEEDLKNLARDIFQYFGLGCRNVTQLYLPEGFNLDLIFESFFEWKEVINHHKYANNYDYNRTIYLMSKEEFFDNNFILLKNSNAIYSPIGVVNFVYYDDLNEVKNTLDQNQSMLQCIVGNALNQYPNSVKFGQTQQPTLIDYADGIDVLAFLKELN
ncbi:MAG TPA: acyl-CoA reductase [Moheibacter sp.]|nr:acyl-CoA reductase [Moheibacter sp.]